jgi:dienelactone hydrolase
VSRQCGWQRWAVGAMLSLMACGASGQPRITQEQVTFPSLDGTTTLQAVLLRRPEESPHAALVLLHGCSGLQKDGQMFGIYRNWARTFALRGYVTLVVDSAGPRGFGETCTRRPERLTMFAERPKDAYAALRYLQAQPFVRADRVGVIGWSQGGATILLAIAAQSSGRPDPMTGPDFRAAVAFYPGLCNARLQSQPFVGAEPGSWTTSIPLLVLHGGADNWTPAAPCEALIAGARRARRFQALSGCASRVRRAETGDPRIARLPVAERGRAARRHRPDGPRRRGPAGAGILRAALDAIVSQPGCCEAKSGLNCSHIALRSVRATVEVFDVLLEIPVRRRQLIRE